AGGVVTAMLDRVISENNGNAGFSVSNGAKVTARNATSAGNLIGFYADSNASELNLESCVSHGNATGIFANSPGTPTIRLSNCVVTDNTSNGLSIVAGAVQSFQNNKLAGNAGLQTGMSAANPGQQ
ncbi:MAG TPA: right-handed parallel beta-helix repeat-containing protein, partial [Beijerinckiaceae bacterium]